MPDVRGRNPLVALRSRRSVEILSDEGRRSGVGVRDGRIVAFGQSVAATFDRDQLVRHAPAASSSAAMSADSWYGTSVSAVPWIMRIGGYCGVTFRTGQ